MNKKYYASEWKERIEEAIKNTSSMTQAYNYLNLERKTFKRMAKELGLWEPNQSGKGMKKFKKKIPLEDILSNKIEFQSHKLKKRLLEEGYKEHKCENCNLTTWMNKKIPLELHHKNGNHNDNSYDNIQLLCTNCHALTENYGNKNKEGQINYSSFEWKEKIKEAIDKTSSMLEACSFLSLKKEIFKRMAIELGLWDSNKAENFSHKKIPLEDILSKKYKFRQSNLKFRLLEEGYKEYKCENCNLSVWLDKKVPIPLELHHINGDHEDNSYENLQLLCPNCHALTENYRAKNIKKK